MKTKNVHTTWHNFCDYMKKWYYTKSHGWKKNLTPSKRFYKSFESQKMVGYSAMCRIEKYAKDKEDIFISSCDDGSFMTSDVVLITHEDEKKFMGTTLILVPQSKQDINQIFLYPCHLNSLIEKLTEIQKRQKLTDIDDED